MDIIQKLAELPSFIEVEGCSFELQLIVNGRVDDVILVYQLMGVDTKSKHCQDYKMYGCWENKFQDGASQGFFIPSGKNSRSMGSGRCDQRCGIVHHRK